MGVRISWSDYHRAAYYLEHPSSLIGVDRYTRVWEKTFLGEPVQFIHKYTDPDRLLVIIGEKIIKAVLGLK